MTMLNTISTKNASYHLAYILFFIFGSARLHAQTYGSYEGDIITLWNPDGVTMTITAPFSYLDPTGTRWDVPIGSVIDGASIPRFAWSFVGNPLQGPYRDASVVHDVACEARTMPWELVHQAFYSGMMASNVPSWKAKLMYAAVYHFGPRWASREQVERSTQRIVERKFCTNGNCTSIPSVFRELRLEEVMVPPEQQTLSLDDFERLRAEIEQEEAAPEEGLTLEQIREFQ